MKRTLVALLLAASTAVTLSSCNNGNGGKSVTTNQFTQNPGAVTPSASATP